jgi:hypothetical protein
VVDKRKRRLIEELCEACKRAYLTAEEDLYMDEWDEMATQAARDAGIASAY